MPEVIPPTPDADDQYFWDGIGENKLLLQRCADCKRLRQPPSPMCPGCNSLEWDTQEEIHEDQVRNGMAVEVFFAEVDGVKLPQFRPRAGG
jgi:uncharacterized OB-fold protein